MNEKSLIGKCPYTTAQKVLTGKWPLLIMHILENGPIRFNELQRTLPNMTHTTLSRQLKRMGDDGLIIRKDYSEVPPKVEYYLSDMGKKFKRVLDELKIWGMDYINYMNHK